MKRTLIVIGILLVLNVSSLLLFRDARISEYDYSGCPPDANCLGKLIKHNWTGYLPPINRLSINILGITFLVISFIWIVRIYRSRH
ncbi:MAG: hypothetical protein WCG30_04010 [Candidatus Saccharibacteria bacterium]